MKGSGKLVEVKVDLYYYCMYTAHFFPQCVLDMLSYILFLIIVFSLVEVI